MVIPCFEFKQITFFLLKEQRETWASLSHTLNSSLCFLCLSTGDVIVCRTNVYLDSHKQCKQTIWGRNLAVSEGQYSQIIFLHILFLQFWYKKSSLERQFCYKDLRLLCKPQIRGPFILIVFLNMPSRENGFQSNS